MAKNYHVVPKDNKWAVKKEGSTRASSISKTQSNAIHVAKELAKRNQSELLIHGKDGQIRERNSYGKDPYPPKG